MSEHNMKRFREGSEIIANFLGQSMRQSQQRNSILIAKLMPLLSFEATGKIIKYHQYVLASGFTGEELLKRHLESLIIDFDRNIHYLEENEIPAFAEIINKTPLISFFFNDD